MFSCQPIEFEQKRPEVRESRTFSSGLVRVRFLGAYQRTWASKGYPDIDLRNTETTDRERTMSD